MTQGDVSAAQRQLRRGSRREQMLVVVLGLLLTAVSTWASGQQLKDSAELRFQTRTAQLLQQLRVRLDIYEQVLKSGVAFMNGVAEPNRRAWRQFVSDLSVGVHFSGFQGIGWAEAIAPDQVAAHEAAVRGEGIEFRDYALRPETPRDFYTAIRWLEPLDWRNRRALGFDMWSEPVRRAAMLRAGQSGGAALSGPVQLVQETDTAVQTGFLMYLPVYSTKMPPGSPTERLHTLRGWVYSPFRSADLLGSVQTGELAELLRVRIEAGDGIGGPPQLLVQNQGFEAEPALGLQTRAQVSFYGATWIIEVRGTEAFLSSMDAWQPLVVAAFGLLITLLLWLIVRSLAESRAQALRLAESAAAIEEARATADAANQAKSRFLAAASHDLRQPLQSLGIFLHLLAGRGNSAQREVYAARALESFDATERLLNSLMDISSLESGMIQPQFQKISLGQLLWRVANEMRPEASQRGLKLRVRTCDAEAETDPVLVERMIRNLLSNALKYTKAGGILLGCRKRRDGWRIEVWDSGMGIPEDRLGIIFEDFYQIENPERDRSKGLGLGLASFSRLARLMGYTTTVRSHHGRGSMFGFTIPRKPHPFDQKGVRDWLGAA